MRWDFFIGACVLTGSLLLANGAPPAAVAMGMALAAAFNLRKRRPVRANERAPRRAPERPD